MIGPVVCCDVRMLSASQRPLSTLVAERRFRADLRARLEDHVAELFLMRERRGDIGLLVASILRAEGVKPDDGYKLPSKAIWRILDAAVWTDHEMIVLGGSAPDGGRCDPATDRWTALAVPAPTGFAARGPVAAWTGRKVAVWSWVSSEAAWGGLYDPATDSWEQTPPSPPQLPKRVPTFVAWTGASVLFWAGFSWDEDDVPYSDGALFTP